MRKGIIWVYDDDRHLGESYIRKLQDSKDVTRAFEPKRLDDENDFQPQLDVLMDRRKKLRVRKLSSDFSIYERHLDLDEASILIVDYDLLKSSSTKFSDGENVSYLVRCFSRCGLIVGLNHYGHNTFDLTLKGHPESWADLNIGSDQLDNPGLWGAKTKGFRPWYWPQLPNYLESFHKKVKDVTKHLDDSIWRVLGFPKESVEIFPRSVSEFMGRKPLETTFREFVGESGNGLREMDKKATDEMVGIIAAARVSKWMERLVLSGQDILVDAPHLAYRFPSLLLGNHSDVNTWNKTANFSSFKNLGLNHKKIENFRFKKEHWLSRPAWFWGEISKCQDIREITEPWTKEKVNYVFCEDSSSFHKRENCKEFVADLDSPYVRRFIRGFKNVEYRPKVRLSI